MAKIKRYTEADGGYHGELAFKCPGCNKKHFINDDITQIPNLPPNHIWYFNGNFENPTIQASVLVEWPENVCHSFIKDGTIEFLPDCTHKLAGQTVELPNIE